MHICDKMQLKIRITVKISNEYNISHALILSTHCLRCIFFTIPGFSLLFAMQHCADSLLFPSIAFLHSTLNLLADRAKGYTVSRRIPFEPPLIKLSPGNDLSSLIFLTEGTEATARQSVYFRLSRLLLRSAKHREAGGKRRTKWRIKKKEEETGCKKRRKRRKTAKEGEEGAGKKWKSACFEVLSTKLEFQKGQVKFSIPSIPSSRPQPSCDPPRLLISFSTLFRPTVSPSTHLFLRSSHLPSPYATSIFSPLFLQHHRWSDSSIGLIFIHRVPTGLVHIVHYSGELLILVWHSETDGPDIPATFYRISMIDYRPLAPNICTLSRCFAFPFLG